MDDLAEHLVLRDRFRRRIAARRTPEERLRLLEQMQAQAWRVLASNAAGHAHFLERNFAARAIDVRPDDAR